MRRVVLALFVLALSSSDVWAKSLHWRDVAVEANLDREGVLHVVETQAFVFDGEWNGGERRFDIRPRQTFTLDGVERIEGGAAIPLRSGDLSAVDRYQLVDGSKLRWRSRLPSDPPFDNKELTYRIRYRIGGILRGRNGQYPLAHDFVFPDRPGAIEHFKLRFTIDPSWRGLESPVTIERNGLPPGASVIVRGTLTHSGSLPRSVVELQSPWIGGSLAVLLVVGVILLFMRFLTLERGRGRMGELAPGVTIDEAWLREVVFSMPPEVVGAAWDGKIGAPEVAAILASLAHEKKIETNLEPKRFGAAKLNMKLIADRDTITGYRRKVINKLFFNDRTSTDTDTIRAHYKSSGLDLGEVIRKPIEAELQRLPHWSSKPKVVNWKATLLLTAGALVLLILTAWGGDNDSALVSMSIFFGVISLVPALIAARLNSRAITTLPERFALVLAFTLPLLVLTIYYLVRAWDFYFRFPVMLASIVWALAVFHLVLEALRIDQAPEKIAARKRLAAARAYFIEQLRSRDPRLEDDWFPYILAFGLGSNVDSWFRAYSKDSAGVAGALSSSGSSSSSSSSSIGSNSSGGLSSGWTGGGGSFGGAGASGSWAIAATAVGSGVASPGSSSSSGGGGGGGGSSSGGGGGGGW